MMVTFILSAHCHCGYTTRGVAVQPVQVNRNTLRGTADGLWSLPERCGECRWPVGWEQPQRMRLHPDSAAEVAAYRRRKGWAA